MAILQAAGPPAAGARLPAVVCQALPPAEQPGGPGCHRLRDRRGLLCCLHVARLARRGSTDRLTTGRRRVRRSRGGAADRPAEMAGRYGRRGRSSSWSRRPARACGSRRSSATPAPTSRSPSSPWLTAATRRSSLVAASIAAVATWAVLPLGVLFIPARTRTPFRLVAAVPAWLAGDMVRVRRRYRQRLELESSPPRRRA